MFLFLYNDNASAISMSIQLNSGAVMQFYNLACHVLASLHFLTNVLSCWILSGDSQVEV